MNKKELDNILNACLNDAFRVQKLRNCPTSNDVAQFIIDWMEVRKEFIESKLKKIKTMRKVKFEASEVYEKGELIGYWVEYEAPGNSVHGMQLFMDVKSFNKLKESKVKV